MSKTKQISKAKQVNNKKQNSNNIATGNEMLNLFKIVLIVCAVLIVFYFITLFVNDSGKTDDYSSNNVASIQYDKILVGQILNRNEDEYYVLVEKENDQYLELYNYYLSSYEGESKGLKYYKVDLSDVFNRNYVGEKTLLDGDISSFRFSDTTLLKIKNGVLTKIYDNREAIVSYLENLK